MCIYIQKDIHIPSYTIHFWNNLYTMRMFVLIGSATSELRFPTKAIVISGLKRVPAPMSRIATFTYSRAAVSVAVSC